MAKKKLNQLNQANGALETQPVTLNQIWGDDGLNKYGTLIESEYVAQLHELNKSDLFAHAAKLGIMPIDNRERLVRTLVREFVAYANNYKAPRFVPQPIKAPSKEVTKILSEGR